MDTSQIEDALKEIGQPYADTRVNVFDVAVESLDEHVLRLRGRVLEEGICQALVDGLRQRFSKLRVDTRSVEVLRKNPPCLRAVATNLTSLHASASFLAEQVTQALNGATVEVLWEEKNWAYVRQSDGYLGWTYLPYLTSSPAPQPTHLITEPVGLLRAAPVAEALLVTRVLGGTAVCVDQTVSRPGADWASLNLAGGAQGWLPAEHLRSLSALPGSPEKRRELLVHGAFTMVGVPYLWGGSSAHGIDCSGFAQLLHRWVGIILPRDADMQYAAGTPVEPPFAVGDLLFFGENDAQRRITHVGISLGGWHMIHSSRRRNGVQVDDVQAVAGLRDSFLCAATYIGR